MKRSTHFIFLLFLLGLCSCKKDPEHSKVIQSFPLDVGGQAIPAEGVQQYVIANNLVLGMADSFIERIRLYSAPTYPELTSVGGKAYRLTIVDDRAGTVNADFRFFDGSHNQIDPVVTAAEGLSLGSIHVEILNGTSALFSYTGYVTVTLETSADLLSPRVVLGTTTLSGSSYLLNFSILSGSRLSGSGLISGGATASGTSPDGPIVASIVFDSGHTSNGSLSWGEQDGRIHLNSNGTGIFVTDFSRIPLP